MIGNIVDATSADERLIFLTGTDNFRVKRATLKPYKGNRTQEKPPFIAEIREYIQKYFPTIVVNHAEADDALGEFLSNPVPGCEHILATLDKDMDMISGKHYCWRGKRKGLYNVSPEEGDKFFGVQMLTGDGTDNIPGLFNLTGQKAAKGLKLLVEEAYDVGGFDKMMDAVSLIYHEAAMDRPDSRIVKEKLNIEECLDEIGDLLWIRRHNYRTWNSWRDHESL